MADTSDKPAGVDTTAGKAAYAFAVRYREKVEPRLPAGMIAHLAADLETLGAPVSAGEAETTAAPSLTEALSAAVGLVTAIHEALRAQDARAAVRKAYGARGELKVTDAGAVSAAAEKIVAQASAATAEALALGILPDDVAALRQAIIALRAATAAEAPPVVSGKARRAAEARLREAVRRIAAAGLLAFAQDAAVRAEIAALLPPKGA